MADITILKGGSFSQTTLHTLGSKQFVRKQISISKNREFGFQRWLSQLKKSQRYASLFPIFFPKILDYGYSNDVAYFDMEYVPDSVTLHEFLKHTTNERIIDDTFSNLRFSMGAFHQARKIPGAKNSIELYIVEEIQNRLSYCEESLYLDYEDLNFHEIEYNGVKYNGFLLMLDIFRNHMILEYGKLNRPETFSHGNLTLENILIQPVSGKITFIDLYEENIIDSVITDYSQILQSSNSKYELYNESVNGKIPVYPGLEYFNKIFIEYLHTRYGNINIIKLFEISQFIRLLPFKINDKRKLKFFYSYASFLFNEYLSHEN